MRMNTESSLRREFIVSSHFLTSCLWSTSTRIEPQPELSTRQQQHSHHVVLQALFYKAAKPREPTNTTGQQQQQYRYSSIVQFSSIKSRENLQINSTATVQQYRYTSIEPFSSISTVYSSTIHPRANSPTLTSDST